MKFPCPCRPRSTTRPQLSWRRSASQNEVPKPVHETEPSSGDAHGSSPVEQAHKQSALLQGIVHGHVRALLGGRSEQRSPPTPPGRGCRREIEQGGQRRNGCRGNGARVDCTPRTATSTRPQSRGQTPPAWRPRRGDRPGPPARPQTQEWLQRARAAPGDRSPTAPAALPTNASCPDPAAPRAADAGWPSTRSVPRHQSRTPRRRAKASS